MYNATNQSNSRIDPAPSFSRTVPKPFRYTIRARRARPLSRYCFSAFARGAVLCAAIVANAQTDAELGGTVRDASGALVPDVSVAVIKLDTGAVRKTLTNEAGYFVVPLLQPGEYQIR